MQSLAKYTLPSWWSPTLQSGGQTPHLPAIRRPGYVAHAILKAPNASDGGKKNSSRLEVG